MEPEAIRLSCIGINATAYDLSLVPKRTRARSRWGWGKRATAQIV